MYSERTQAKPSPDPSQSLKDGSLRDAIDALVILSCKLTIEDRVLLIYDDETDCEIIDPFCSAILQQTGTYNLQKNNAFCLEQKAEWEACCERLEDYSLLIDIGSHYVLHAPWLQEALERGLRYACFPELNPCFLRRHVQSINHYETVMELSRQTTDRLNGARSIRLASPSGYDVNCSLKGVHIDNAGEPARCPGAVAYISGQVSFYPQAKDVNGIFEIRGIAGPLGPIETPILVEVSEGIVIGFQGGEEASRLESWVHDHETPWIRHLSHISLGVFPDLMIGKSTVLSERAFGAVVIGVGSQPPGLGLFPDIEPDGTPHWDLVASGYEVVIDGEKLF